MARNKPNDPFNDDDWGMPGGGRREESDEMPEASTDPERSPFLKPYHLKEKQGTLQLVSASGGTEYSDVVLHIKVNGQNFRLGLRAFDPGYIACKSTFGAKRSDWHGTLKYRVMPHKGNPDGYVAVRPASLKG